MGRAGRGSGPSLPPPPPHPDLPTPPLGRSCWGPSECGETLSSPCAPQKTQASVWKENPELRRDLIAAQITQAPHGLGTHELHEILWLPFSVRICKCPSDHCCDGKNSPQKNVETEDYQ